MEANSDLPVPVNIVRGTHGQLVLFLVLNIWPSHFALPILVGIIVLSKRIQRHATLVNLLVAFVVVGISSSLLLYAGRIEGPEPSKVLCLLQASLLYGMPGMTSTAACMLVLQMFLVIKAAHYGQAMLDRDHFVRYWLMVIFPWVAFFASVVATAVVGSSNPDKISRNRRFFYCSVENLPLTNTITVYAAIVLFVTLVLEVWTMVILYRRWAACRRDSRLKWTIDLSLPVRILAFGLYVILALSLSLLSVKTPSTPVPDLAIASASVFVVIIFGTQSDILGVLLFRRKPTPPPPPPPPPKENPLSPPKMTFNDDSSSISTTREWSWRPQFKDKVKLDLDLSKV